MSRLTTFRRTCESGHAWTAATQTDMSVCPVCGQIPDAQPKADPYAKSFILRLAYLSAIIGITVGLRLSAEGLDFLGFLNPARKPAHQSNSLSIAFSHDGRFWTFGEDKLVLGWSPNGGAESDRIQLDTAIVHFAMKDDGRGFLVAMDKYRDKIRIASTVQFLDRDAGRVLWQCETASPVYRLGFSDDGKMAFLVLSLSGEVQVLDAEKGSVLRILKTEPWTRIDAVYLSANSRRAYFVVSRDRQNAAELIIQDLDGTGSPLVTHPLGETSSEIRALRVSPDGIHLAVAGGLVGQQGEVVIADARTGAATSPILRILSPFISIAWTQTPDVFSAVDNNGVFHAITLDNGKWIDRPRGLPGEHSVLSAILSVDGREWGVAGYKNTRWGRDDEVWEIQHAEPEPWGVSWSLAFLSVFLSAPLVLIAFTLWYRARRSRLARVAGLISVAQQMNFVFSEGTTLRMVRRLEVSSLFSPKYPEGGRLRFGDKVPRFRNVIQGKMEKRETIFGCLWLPNDYFEHMPSCQLIIFPDAVHGLPQFKLQPEGISNRFDDLFLNQDIDFDHSQAAIDFSKKYLLQGTDSNAVRKLFDDRLIEYFAATDGWTICCEGGHLSFERYVRDTSWKKYFTTSLNTIDVDFLIKSWNMAAVLTKDLAGRALEYQKI